MDNIPVILLNWNGFDDTVECVNSVLNQCYQNFTIYLADNGSDNHEFEKLNDIFAANPKIKMIPFSTNLGFTAAHNRLFEIVGETGAEYVALINNDAVADKRWLEDALNTARNKQADMVACMMLDYYNHSIVDSAGLFLLSSGEILPTGHGLPENKLPKIINPVAACGGACLYRLSMLKETGFFDPYFSTGYEDAELGFRAFLMGKKIILARDSIVFHKMSRSVSKVFNRQKAQKIQEDINYTWLKLMPAGLILLNALVNIPRTVFILLIHLFSFRFRFLSIYLNAIIRTFTKDLKIVATGRKSFRGKRKRSIREILKIQHCWLSYDINRFYRYIIRKEKNRFEKY